jgi:ribosomal protein S12 methylthiotransferase accessory factor
MLDISTDRLRSAAETLALVEPHFPRLGITRLARQTGLDRTGIPCFAAIRPNSRTLAAHYGKGLSDDAAKVSAVMEALEFALAEAPRGRRRVGTLKTLCDAGVPICACNHLLPPHHQLDSNMELIWIAGERLGDGAEVWVPLDAVALGDGEPALTDMARTTNGLASGNSSEEAALHGLCELIERDALTLWSFAKDAKAMSDRCVDPAGFGSRAVDAVVERVTAAGLELRLFDITTDTGVPCLQAVLGEAGVTATSRRFDVAAGSSCHPFAAHAAVSAMVEAAQSRLTNIAGSRDDFLPAEYRQPAGDDLATLLACRPVKAEVPSDLCSRRTEDLLAKVLGALDAADIREIVSVNLGGAGWGVAVRKVICPELEDNLSNCHWHPGPRAFRAMFAGARQ